MFCIIRIIFSLLAVSLLAAACGVRNKTVSYPCPNVFILQDAKKQVRFKSGSGRDITDIVFQSEIMSFRGNCLYEKRAGKWEAEVDLALQIVVRRGRSNKTGKVAFQYFAAIPMFRNQVQGKSIFPVVGRFKGVNTTFVYEDKIRLVIPVEQPSAGSKLDVVLGLQLSAEELIYNRGQRRR